MPNTRFSMNPSPLNIKIAGLGGMGVLSAAEVLARTAFNSGRDVKKAEVHGMSQRGGSVASEVRIAPEGGHIQSPMIPFGEVDYLVTLAPEWEDIHMPELKSGAVHISTKAIDPTRLPSIKAINVAAMGILSTYLTEFPESLWIEALDASFAPKLHAGNRQAFAYGRSLGKPV